MPIDNNKLALIRQEYILSIPQKIHNIDSKYQLLLNSEPTMECVTDLYLLIHNLTGSGRMYMLDNISDQAGDIEFQLKELKEQNTNNIEQTISEIGKGIKILLSNLHEIYLKEKG